MGKTDSETYCATFLNKVVCNFILESIYLRMPEIAFNHLGKNTLTLVLFVCDLDTDPNAVAPCLHWIPQPGSE